jgi:ABC-type branched-subunit amino acid transport system substrate-binding protein
MRASLWAAPAVLAALAVGGCAAASSSSLTASGKTLVIYASNGADTADPAAAQDILDAEKLAFSQHGSQVGSFRLQLVELSHQKLSDNARTAIQDTSSVAYLGEVVPGSSADSLGITNAQDLLQVSPTDTALELTQATGAVPGAPNKYYESLKTYGRTFARVVPSTALEAKAQVQEMRALGVRSLFVANDGSPYGQAVALAVKQDAAGAGITVDTSASAADAMFDGASSAAAAAHTFNAHPSLKLFAPSAIDQPSLAASVSSSARQVYVSTPGFLPKDLNTQARQFVSSFKQTYGHAPAGSAIFGYEAMQAVLYAITKAGSAANNRGRVVREFFSIQNRASPLGSYSINSNGDTNLAQFVFSRLRAGKLVPFKSVPVQG